MSDETTVVAKPIELVQAFLDSKPPTSDTRDAWRGSWNQDRTLAAAWSKVTDFVYAAHLPSGSFFRSIANGSTRLVPERTSEVIKSDREWLPDFLSQLPGGDAIMSVRRFQTTVVRPPNRLDLDPVRVPPIPPAPAAYLLPAPAVRVRTTRLIVEESTSSVELRFDQVVAALRALGLKVPDKAQGLEIVANPKRPQSTGDPLDSTGFLATWTTRDERTEDVS